MPITQIILIHHTHTDLGYTASCADVAVRQAIHLANALELCRRDRRCRWTIEASWALEMFRRRASREQWAALGELVRSGQIELTAFYAQPLTQLCDLEGLFSAIEPTFEMARDLGGPRIGAAILDDVGGLSFNIPQVLRHFGVGAIVLGCGGWRVMLPFTTLPHLFYLAGPDGSRVLCYHLGHRRGGPAEDTPAQYGFGMIYFLWPMLREIDRRPLESDHEGQAGIMGLVGRQGIDALVSRLEGEGYPFDTLLLQVAADNWGPNPRLLEAVDAWNAKHARPRVRLGTAAEFFADLEHRYGGMISTIQGELTCSWTEHATTHAAATSLYRRAARRLNTVCAIESMRWGGGAELDDAARQVAQDLSLYTDHTFGLSMWTWEQKQEAYGSLWDDALDLPRSTWEDKARYARRAWDIVQEQARRQRIELAAADPDASQKITILNPHASAWSGTATFASPQEWTALQSAGGTIGIPCRPINFRWHEHRVDLESVPPFACIHADLGRSEVSESRRTAPIRIEIDPETGGIRSLRTPDRQADWVDSAIGQLNEVLYYGVEGVLPGVEKCGLCEPVRMRRRALSSIRISGSERIVERRFQSDEGEMLVETQYRLDAAGLRIRNRVRKIHSTAKEICWFAFPFGLGRPFVFRVAQQGQVTEFPRQRLPGSANCGLGVQDFVAACDEGATALLVPLDAPVIALGRPGYYRFGLEYQPIESPAIYSYAFGNLWNTNCPVHQQGELVFEYHLSFRSQRFDPVWAYRRARGAAEPAVVLPGQVRMAGPLIRSQSDGVLIESIRPIGRAIWRVRMIEVLGEARRGAIRLDGARVEAFAVQDRYDDQPWQPTGDGRLELAFRAAECKTVLLRVRPAEESERR